MPIYLVRSYSPFKNLAETDPIPAYLNQLGSNFKIKGYKFSATMQMRNSEAILKQHGRIERCKFGDLPSIANLSWEGSWTVITQTWRDLGIDIDEIPVGTMSSDFGQIPADGGDYLRFLLFVKRINSYVMPYLEKKKWIRIGYNAIGEDGEPFGKFMDHFGKILTR